MIYLNYQREEIFIDESGRVLHSKPSAAASLATMTDTSTIGSEKDGGFRFYSKLDMKGQKVFYLERQMYHGKDKSLLQALRVRPGAICGIYFSNRLLLFTFRAGKLEYRFTSDLDVDIEKFEFPFVEWGLNDDAALEVYGHTLPMSALAERIRKISPYLDSSHEDKRLKAVQVGVSALVVVFAFAAWGGMILWKDSLEGQQKKVKADIARCKDEMKKEARKRLPLYLDAQNIPLDAVVKSLSFLEDKKFNDVKFSVNKKDSFDAKVIVVDPQEAYRIRQEVRNAQINVKGGGIEISFSREIPQDNTGLSDRSRYTGLFNF